MTRAESHPADEPTLSTDAPASATTAPCQSRRRWFQFRLRTLMVFMVIVSILLAAFGWRLRRAQRQAAIVAELRALGVYAAYESDEPPNRDQRWQFAEQWLTRDFFENVVSVNASEYDRVGFIRTGAPIPLSDARKFWQLVCQLPALRALIVYDDQVTPADIRLLTRNPRLEQLIIQTTVITDEHLGAISDLKCLKGVIVGADSVRNQGQAVVTYRGVQHLHALPYLTHLDLSATTVDDRAAQSLARLERLEGLYLVDTQLTDEGLRHFVALKHLTRINVSGSRVTKGGASMLQTVLPNCKVECYVTRE